MVCPAEDCDRVALDRGGAMGCETSSIESSRALPRLEMRGRGDE